MVEHTVNDIDNILRIVRFQGYFHGGYEGGVLMAIVHPIGLPENDSEREAIASLAEHLPDDYILFHNLELGAPSGLPYEYDIIVIAPHAVYTLEVKGYRGQIQGNAQEWELE